MLSPHFPGLTAATHPILTWSLLTEHEYSVTVTCTTRHAPGYLLTRDVNITRGDWQVWSVDGPELDADDAAELCGDVQRWAESGRGVCFRSEAGL